MAPMPPVTAALVPILSSLENVLAPFLGAYLPALDLIRQVMNYFVPLMLGVQAIDILRSADSWLAGKSFKTFKPLSTVFELLVSTLNNSVAAPPDQYYMGNPVDQSFENTLSFAADILQSIETSAQLYG